MDLPIYKLIISSDLEDEAEVDFIALVDRPAIQRNFLAFKERQKFEIISEDKHILSGALMIADMPIYRNNEEFGEHYVARTIDIRRVLHDVNNVQGQCSSGCRRRNGYAAIASSRQTAVLHQSYVSTDNGKLRSRGWQQTRSHIVSSCASGDHSFKKGVGIITHVSGNERTRGGCGVCREVLGKSGLALRVNVRTTQENANDL